MKLRLKSSARIKKRYLLLEAESREIVKKVILEYIGALGWARALPVFLDLKKGKEKLKGKIVLSVERAEVLNVRAAFEASKENIKVLKVSGTLNGLES